MSSSEFFCLSMTSHFCWPALVQVMAWHQTGTKPLPEPMMTQVQWRIFDVYQPQWFGRIDTETHLQTYLQPFTGQICRHDDVIKWKHIPRYWPFVRGIHRSPVNSPTKVNVAGFGVSLICAWTNGWVNNRHAGDLGRNRAHYDVTVMVWQVDETEDRLIIISIETGALCDQPTTKSIWIINLAKALWWRHNERDSVSNHQPHDCLPNRLFSRRSKKTSKLCVTGLCVGNSPGTG